MDVTEIFHDTSHVDRAICEGQLRATMREKALARKVWLSVVAAAAPAFATGLLTAWLLQTLAASDAVARSAPIDLGRLKADKQSAAASGKVVKDYVLFHTMDVEGGFIETGWHYSNENDKRPDEQWCHFRSNPREDGTSLVMPIERLPKFRSACVWFDRAG